MSWQMDEPIVEVNVAFAITVNVAFAIKTTTHP